MSVSHYVVSWVQVVGLIVGLDGFFFLSIGIFGKKSTPWFRALLPATGMVLAILIAFQGEIGVSLPPDSSDVVWLIALTYTALIYFAALLGPSKRKAPFDRFMPFYYLGLAMLLTLTCVVALGVDTFKIFRGEFTAADLHSIVLLFAALLNMWSFASIDWLPRVFTEERLQKLGFILSAVAILTQFIPPVLDLLNIPVK